MDTPIRKRRSSFSLDASKQKTAYESCRCAEFLLCLTVVPFNSTLESAIANLVSFKSLSQDCVVALCKAVSVAVGVKKEETSEEKKRKTKKEKITNNFCDCVLVLANKRVELSHSKPFPKDENRFVCRYRRCE